MTKELLRATVREERSALLDRGARLFAGASTHPSGVRASGMAVVGVGVVKSIGEERRPGPRTVQAHLGLGLGVGVG